MTDEEIFAEHVGKTGDSSLRLCPARTVTVEYPNLPFARTEHWRCDRWDEHDDESHVWKRTRAPESSVGEVPQEVLGS